MYEKTKSGLAIASENEILVLKYLHKFGWLRSKDLASLIWQKHDKRGSNNEPDFRRPAYSVSGLRMSQITLKRLKDKKFILTAVAPDNAIIYALSQKGVNRLNQIGVESVSGKDLIRVFSFEQYRHRVISNELAISGLLQGFKVFSERQIAQNKWLFNENGYLGKKPDCLIENRNTVWWVEVEKSRKNQKDYQALIDWLIDVHRECKRPHEKPEIRPGLGLKNIIFICSKLFEKRLVADLLNAGWEEEKVYLRIEFINSLYTFRQTYFL